MKNPKKTQWHQFILTLTILLGVTPTNLANAQNIPNYCQNYQNQFLAVETPNFWVNLCGGAFPNTYIAVSKAGSQERIALTTNFDGTQFVAYNGTIRYTLNAYQLVVSRNNQVLRAERVLRWY